MPLTFRLSQDMISQVSHRQTEAIKPSFLVNKNTGRNWGNWDVNWPSLWNLIRDDVPGEYPKKTALFSIILAVS